ncbi:DinB family protein [Alicyclobacillus hesperidum URH17-3-68]|uniref:DinB family protein n=1 Tax=Alicyclobacillus hesperidum TaxID=89784 RepID=UPI000281C25F|nr:DinB family protein [Alicyclobacillus hesperidum]EJY54486.1 DinB family protein [Alicyclobacillus hesperidum URH17-3-68]
MIQEVADLYQLLANVHASVDKMLEGLSDDDWVKKPQQNLNNIASIVEHTALVERRFFAQVKGEVPELDAGAPFRAESWDVPKIKALWADNLEFAKHALEALSEADLAQFGAKLGIGEVNKRQLIAYTVAHTAHHRGQIPLVKKLLGL